MSGKRGTFQVRRQKVGLVCKVLCARHFINFSTEAECVVFFSHSKRVKKSPEVGRKEEEEKVEEKEMKDLAKSVKPGVFQQRGGKVTRSKVWLKNELIRAGLAESLSTYVMMVRIQYYHKISEVSYAFK